MPTLDPNSYFQSAGQSFQQASQGAMPNPQQLETASNRLTSRLAANQASNQRQLQNRYAGLGRSGGGGYEQRSIQNMQNTSNSLATGLADLQNDFFNRQQQGAQILGTIGQGQTALGSQAGQLPISQQRANTETQQVANQLQLGLGSLQEQALARQLEEQLGLGRLSLEEQLGMGRLGVEQQALEETARRNQQEALVDFFNSFIQGGNLSSTGSGRGQQFDAEFQNLLNSLYGSFSI